jgi:hypothetical protein
MTAAELSYKMCFSVPPMKCLRHQPCPFYQDRECTIATGYNRQRSCQHVNNMQNTKRQWTLAAQIENE